MLETETLYDSATTKRAARIHPEAPTHFPPLGLTDLMPGIFYAPELIAPLPCLVTDSAGISRSVLERHHNILVNPDGFL